MKNRGGWVKRAAAIVVLNVVLICCIAAGFEIGLKLKKTILPVIKANNVGITLGADLDIRH